ncbi:MAG: DUF4271 domain-containing protein [Marinoscillum sp.]
MDTLFVKDLRVAWLTFDEQNNTVPYKEDKSEIIFFEIPSNTDPNTFLMIKCLTSFDIWINDQLFYEGFRGKKELNIDSLISAHLTTPSITLYARSWKSNQLRTELYKLTGSQNRNPYTRINRQGFLSSDVYLIAAMILIGLLGVYRRFFPSSFSKAFQNPFGFKLRGLSAEDAYHGFGSLDNVISILLLGLMSSVLVSYLGYQPVAMVTASQWAMSFMGVLVLGLMFTFYLIVKYFLGYLVALVFDFKSIPNIQIQDFTHFFVLIISICLGLSALDYTIYNFTSENLKNLVVITLVISMVFFQFWLLLKLDKFYSHRKLMIITYLCTTEFLPGFLIVYWLVKS